MKLNSEFYRLPLKFDVERLQLEANAFSESDWIPHPTGYPGNSSIPLISVNGEQNDDFSGPMKTTSLLNQCPYIKQVIASFGEVFGRSRLMRLGPGYEVPEHSDINYHWYSRVRIHIPIITFPEVKFYCGDKNVHMAAGETWIFNSWEMHKVINGASKNRIHLVIDTSGSSLFWDLIERSEEPHNDILHPDSQTEFLKFDKNATPVIRTENYNTPVVMNPGELDALCLDLIDDARSNTDSNPVELEKYNKCLNDFRYNWRSQWSIYDRDDKGWPVYQELVNIAYQEVNSIPAVTLGSNLTDARQVFNARVLVSCLNPPKKLTATQADTRSNKDDKVGRNRPCPCGSGKKYKKCHGA